MSQHDLDLANAAGVVFRADLNAALVALGTLSSGATAPGTTFAYQWWADTTTGLLKIRNAANSAWVTVGTLGSSFLNNVQSGGALGTPSSGTLTNCTGLPLGSVTGLGSNVATFLATPSSANLAAAVTGETGSGALVFATSPTLVGPALGTPASGNLANCTGYPAGQISGLGALATANSVNQGTIDSAAVGQGELKSTSGTVSATSNTAATLPGGAYGFYTRSWVSTVIAGTAELHLSGTVNWTSAATTVQLQINTGATLFASQQYIQASPPYDLGDGEVRHFVFAAVDGSGKIVSVYSAPDPPWAYNGPTIARATRIDARTGRIFQRVRRTTIQARDARRDPALMRDYLDELSAAAPVEEEITQAVKQADMAIIPHPFGPDVNGRKVVVIDPVSPLCEKLCALQSSGEITVNELLHSDYLRLGNSSLSRAAPPGVMAVSARWRQTR